MTLNYINISHHAFLIRKKNYGNVPKSKAFLDKCSCEISSKLKKHTQQFSSDFTLASTERKYFTECLKF